MQQIDIEQALCHEAVLQGLLLSSIDSDPNRVFCFRSINFQAGEVICHCYGTIVYYNLNERTRTKKKYEEGILEVDQETFKSFSIPLEVHGKKFEDVGRITGDVQVSLVPAPFCAARYIATLITVTKVHLLEIVANRTYLYSRRKQTYPTPTNCCRTISLKSVLVRLFNRVQC